MSSKTPGGSSASTNANKKSASVTASNSSSLGINPNVKRATSDDDISHIISAPLARESSSGFNYQTLTETTPVTQTKIKTKPPVRSHSSTNAELSYHLQQLRNLGKHKPVLGNDERNNNEDRIHLTSSNLKIVCNENGKETSIQSTVDLQAVTTSIELPATWKPAIQQVTIQRDAWDHKAEFLLAVIGYAVDLGNVWRFPTAVYSNGGGAFFIPYFILLIFGGLPLFYMELALGQYHRSGVFTIWKHICPLVKGIGWATVIINFMTAMFYNTIISWAVYYLVVSFNGFRTELPWKSCNNSWNSECCIAADVTQYEVLSKLNERTQPGNMTTTSLGLVKNCSRFIYSTEEYFHGQLQGIDKSRGFNHLGTIKWELALSLLIVFVLVYFALWKGIKSSGKAVWITAIAPYAVLFILLIRGVTLSGASIGIDYYLRPKLELLLNFSIWNAAATQIFFSLGPGFGVLIALSSYNKFHNNCYRDALVTSTINCATSLLSGFVVFSTLGHMASVSNKTIPEVINEKGSELVFIVYPHTIALMNWSTLWAILFFFMIITLGIDSTFGGLESIITGLCDEFPNVFGRHRSLFVLGVLILCYFGSLPTCTHGGDYIVTLMNEIAVSPALLLVVLVECIAVSWFYGVNRFSMDIQAMIGSRPALFWRIIWCLISPIFLSVILYMGMDYFLNGEFQVKTSKFNQLPTDVKFISYCMVFVPILCIPSYAIYKLWITPGKNFFQRCQRAIRPEEPLLNLMQSRSSTGQQNKIEHL